MKKLVKMVAAIMLAALMLFGVGAPLLVERTEADAKMSEEEIRSKLNAFYKKYPHKSTWAGTFAGGKQCYGFGKMVIYNVFGKAGKSYRTWNYSGSSLTGMKKIGGLDILTENNVKWLLLYAQPGDVLQFQASNGNGHQHTMIVWDVDENGVTIYDCNRGKDTVKREYMTWKQFVKLQSSPKRGPLSLLRATNAGNYSDCYTVYPTHGTVQVKKATALKTYACNQNTYARSYTYTTLQPGTKVEVIRLVSNSYSNYWYEVKYDGRTNLYIYSKDVVWTGWNSSDIKGNGITVPSGTVAAGKDVKLKGTVDAQYNALSRIESAIYMGSKVAVRGSRNLNSVKSVSINDDALKKVNVSKLTACGNYKYVIKVECMYYTADGNRLSAKTGSVNVYTSFFTVR